MYLVASPLEPQARWMAWNEVEEQRAERRSCWSKSMHEASHCHDSSPTTAPGSTPLKSEVQHTRNYWKYNLFFALVSV